LGIKRITRKGSKKEKTQEKDGRGGTVIVGTPKIGGVNWGGVKFVGDGSKETLKTWWGLHFKKVCNLPRLYIQHEKVCAGRPGRIIGMV